MNTQTTSSAPAEAAPTAAPTGTEAPTGTTETTTSSPSADPPVDGLDKPPAAADPAAAARALVPETAEAYALNIAEPLKAVIGDTADDPVIGALRDYALTSKWSQGQMDDVFGLLEHLQKKDLLPAPFDPKAELVQLGDNGEARRSEVETWALQLKDRGDITDAEYGELMSLAPTAAGVTLVEKIRKMAGDGGNIKPPGPGGGGTDANGDTEAQKEARAMSRDERYGRDHAFTKEADRKWMEAFK